MRTDIKSVKTNKNKKQNKNKENYNNEREIKDSLWVGAVPVDAVALRGRAPDAQQRAQQPQKIHGSLKLVLKRTKVTKTDWQALPRKCEEALFTCRSKPQQSHTVNKRARE